MILEPEDRRFGWGPDLAHLEPTLVVADFSHAALRGYAPELEGSVACLAIGDLVLADKRPGPEESAGWQRVLKFPTYAAIWVHPAILGRFRPRVEVLDEHMRPSRQGHEHVVSVLDMPGKIARIEEHTGVCAQVLTVKLREGGLLEQVLRGLQGLRREHTRLSFACKHGKHRSVAAHTVCLTLCPLAQGAHTGKRIYTCAAGCEPMACASLHRMIAAYVHAVLDPA